MFDIAERSVFDYFEVALDLLSWVRDNRLDYAGM